MKNWRRRVLSILLILTLLVGGISYPTTNKVQAATKQGIKVTVKHPEMNTVKLTWNVVSGADGYHIYCSTTKDGTYELIGTVTSNRFIIEELTRDKTYYMKVVAFTEDETGYKELLSSENFAVKSTKMGIDVSHHQGEIDWTAVKKSGVEFAIIRTSYSTATADRYFDINMKNAKKAGVPVGVYIYSLADNVEEAKKEANYVINALKGYDLDYPVAFDIEDSVQKKLSKAQNTKIINAFCTAIEAAGYDTMVYTGYNFMNTYLDYNSIKQYEIWMARYNSYLGFAHPVRFWQYSSTGKVAGIAGNVDLNYEFDYKESRKDSITYDYSKDAYSYTPSKAITVEALAKTLGVSVASLIQANPTFTATTTVKAGVTVKVTMNLLHVPMPSVTASNYDTVTLKWKLDPNADGYRIYESTSKSGAYRLLGTTTTNSYTRKQASALTTYYYKVEAFRIFGGEEETHISNPVSCKITIPGVSSVKASFAGATAIKLTWSKVTGVDGYQIYSSTSKTGTYRKVATVKGNSTTSYTNTKLKYGTTYYYKVVPYVMQKDVVKAAPSNKIVSYQIQLAVPSKVKALTNSYNSNKLTWSKVSNANQYYVYAATSKSGTYKKVATTKTNSFTHTKLTSNKAYYYKVVAVRKEGSAVYKSKSSSVVSATPKLAKVANLKVASKSYNAIKYTWSKVKDASGYEVYRATSKNGKYTKIATVKTNSYTLKKLSFNKNYYVKIVPIKTVSKKKVSGPASSIVVGKTALAKPSIKKISTGKRYVTLSWNKVAGASGYEIYRATSKNGTYKKIKTITGTSFKNIKLTSNKTYYYKIRAYRIASSKKVPSATSAVRSIKVK